MSKYKWLGRHVPRIDSKVKATGEFKYMTDLHFSGALVGKVLRSTHAHALIKRIDLDEALKLPKVVTILTAKDVPGLNGFGIEKPDQPVLCDEKVRYIGDAVALVIAEDLETAEEALKYIKVDYEILPAIFTPEDALLDGAVKIHEHEDGNVLRYHFSTIGDVEKAFEEADVVVENTYTTPYQEHAYIETEGGYGVPIKDGVELFYPAQYGYRDRKQLSVILNIPEENIHINSSPIGGGFGGKDDMLLQPLLALGAIKTGKTIKIHISREESFMVSTKRLPFKITMKTAANKNGEFLAHKVYAITEAGPYAGISGPVFNYAMENSCCAYKFPNVSLEGYCVYTNNSNTGAFRGFGNNQMTFATESQVDEIARKLNMDPIDLRRINCIKPGARHSLGHKVSGSVIGAEMCLDALKNSQLWKEKEKFKQDSHKPWLKRGIGLALSQHGAGLGNALNDDAEVKIEITQNGIINIFLGTEEMGQGSITTFCLMATEDLGVSPDIINIICGKTAMVPDAGPATASRSTLIVGNALLNATGNLKKCLKSLGEELWNSENITINSQGIYCESCENKSLSWQDISERLSEKDINEIKGNASMPITDLKIDLGLHYIHSYVSQIVGVEINTLTGEVNVLETEIFPDAGIVINSLCYEGQSEGGTVQSMGFTLMENYKIDLGKPKTRNMQTYLVPIAMDIPKIKVTPIITNEKEGPFGAKGLGEPVSIPVIPAIMNAIKDAVGVRIMDLPANPEKVLMKLQGK